MDDKLLFCVSVISGENALYGPEWKELESSKSLLDVFLHVCGTKILGQQVQVLVSKERSFLEAAVVQVCSPLKTLANKQQNYVQFVLKEDTTISKNVFSMYQEESGKTNYSKLNIMHGSQSLNNTITTHTHHHATLTSWKTQRDQHDDFCREEKTTPLQDLTSKASFENMSVEEICEEIRRIKSAELSKNKLSTWVEETKRKQENNASANLLVDNNNENTSDEETSTATQITPTSCTQQAENKLNNTKQQVVNTTSTKTNTTKCHISERLARLAEPRRRRCDLTKVNNLQAEKKQKKLSTTTTNTSKTIVTPIKKRTRKSLTEPLKNKIAVTKRNSCSPSMTRGSSTNSTFIKTGVKITQTPKGYNKSRETKSTEYFVEIFTKEKSVKNKNCKTPTTGKKRGDYSMDSLMSLSKANESSETSTEKESSVEKIIETSMEVLTLDDTAKVVETKTEKILENESRKSSISMSEMLTQIHNDTLESRLSVDNSSSEEQSADETKASLPQLKGKPETKTNVLEYSRNRSPVCDDFGLPTDKHNNKSLVHIDEKKNIDETKYRQSSYTQESGDSTPDHTQKSRSIESSPEDIIFDKNNIDKAKEQSNANNKNELKIKGATNVSFEDLISNNLHIKSSLESLGDNNRYQSDDVEMLNVAKAEEINSRIHQSMSKNRATSNNIELSSRSLDFVAETDHIETCNGNDNVTTNSSSEQSSREEEQKEDKCTLKKYNDLLWSNSVGIKFTVSSEKTELNRTFVVKKDEQTADPVNTEEEISLNDPTAAKEVLKDMNLPVTPITLDVYSIEQENCYPEKKQSNGLILKSSRAHNKPKTPDKNRKKWGNTIEGMDGMLIPSLQAFSTELRLTTEKTAARMRVLYEDWQVKYEKLDPMLIKSQKDFPKTSPKHKVAGGEQEGIADVFRNMRKMEIKLKTMEQAASAMVKALEETLTAEAPIVKKGGLHRAKSFKWSELKSSARQASSKEWLNNHKDNQDSSGASSDSDS